jgi:hypothetical protein
MNTLSLTEKSKDAHSLGSQGPEHLEEPWFDEGAPSSQRRPSAPPVSVGEFLGDPVADAWLR